MHWKAIFIGLGTYLLCYVAYTLLTDISIGDDATEIPGWFGVVFAVIGWLVYVIPGYVAGKIASERGVIHGAITGLLVAVVTLLVYFAFIGFRMLEPEYFSNIYMIPLWSAFMCGLGGGLGQLHAKYSLKA
ncbi:DUF3792 family protein [Sedimenticola thiotaurini]|uniref:DUF1761 domain-containing protein n=1 Tax=Sedimenticola thiotaurini TaxID=1543721 RepID=A0A0F7K120_9GAMM|nr:DUF3792 family protein [Sedimenticola thiotaurini]AKH20880.1 hypothetical protein AAY24_11555 [Sedimenticola thiotaurini]